jgi:hypothetical protein
MSKGTVITRLDKRSKANQLEREKECKYKECATPSNYDN